MIEGYNIDNNINNNNIVCETQLNQNAQNAELLIHHNGKSALAAKVTCVAIITIGLLVAAFLSGTLGAAMLINGKATYHAITGVLFVGLSLGLLGGSAHSLISAKSGNMFKTTNQNLTDCGKYVLKNLKTTALATIGGMTMAPVVTITAAVGITALAFANAGRF